MEIGRLQTFSLHFRPDARLIIPVYAEACEKPGDDPHHRASLTAAQSTVLFRNAMAFPAVAEHIRNLASGNSSFDDDRNDAFSPPAVRPQRVNQPDDIRCSGGRVYWW